MFDLHKSFFVLFIGVIVLVERILTMIQRAGAGTKKVEVSVVHRSGFIPRYTFRRVTLGMNSGGKFEIDLVDDTFVADMLVKFEFPIVKRLTPTVSFPLKLLLAALAVFMGSILISVFAWIQALLQTLVLLLCLIGACALTMVLFPLQVLTFPIWIMFWLVGDTAVVVYGVYLIWWSSKPAPVLVPVQDSPPGKAGKKAA
jgi:hypothetical protein